MRINGLALQELTDIMKELDRVRVLHYTEDEDVIHKCCYEADGEPPTVSKGYREQGIALIGAVGGGSGGLGIGGKDSLQEDGWLSLVLGHCTDCYHWMLWMNRRPLPVSCIFYYSYVACKCELSSKSCLSVPPVFVQRSIFWSGCVASFVVCMNFSIFFMDESNVVNERVKTARVSSRNTSTHAAVAFQYALRYSCRKNTHTHTSEMPFNYVCATDDPCHDERRRAVPHGSLLHERRLQGVLERSAQTQLRPARDDEVRREAPS